MSFMDYEQFGGPRQRAQCRACPTTAAATCFLFAPANGHVVPLSEMLSECTNFEVRDGDGLSRYLCKECARTLPIAYQFKQIAVEQDHNRRRNVPYNEPQTLTNRWTRPDNPNFHFGTLANSRTPHYFKCLDCPVFFTNKQLWKRHIESHIKPSRFQCANCPQNFTAFSQLLKHRFKKHNVKKPIACPQCPKTFFTIENRNAHMFTKHKPQIKVEPNLTIKTEIIEPQNNPSSSVAIKVEPTS